MGAPKMAPRSSPRKKSTTLQHLFDLDSKPNDSNPAINNGGGGFLPPPPPESETDELLSLISHCTHLFTFTDPSESPSQQDLKRQNLLQLLSTIRASKTPLTGRILSPLIAMLSANLFRPLPPPSYAFIQSDDDTPPAAPAPAWPHLQIIYNLLSVTLTNTEPKYLRRLIDHAFLSNLLCLFHSEDPLERDRLKNVYHQIYSRLPFHRAFMRKSVNYVLLNFAFEPGQSHCGISELLEIWGSIINGFAVPLKEEHKLFLMRVLIPLHKPEGMIMYYKQLAYCVLGFVMKDPGLAEVVVKGIVRYWPVTNCQKEVLLIGELEDLVGIIGSDQYGKLALPLCSQIARCLNSCNSQVAERAVCLWNNEQFVSMAAESMEEVLPSVVEAIEKNITRHWSKSVRQLTASVKKMLEEMEPKLYAKCLEEFNRRESMAGDEEMKRKEKWDTLELAAARVQFLHQPN